MLAGVELQRFGLQADTIALAETAGIAVASTLLGRSVVSEVHPLYIGLYEGGMGRREVTEFVESSDCRILLGTILTDIDLGAGMNGVSLGIEARRRTSVRGVVLLSNLALPTVLSTLPPDLQGGWSYLLKTSVSDVGQVGRAMASAERSEVLVDEYLKMMQI